MAHGYQVTFNDKEIQKLLKQKPEALKREFKAVVNATSAAGLRHTKASLPSRSGDLAKSIQLRIHNSLQHEIFSQQDKKLTAIEHGRKGKGRRIRAKRAKMLMLIFNDKYLTGTRAHRRQLTKEEIRQGVEDKDIVFVKSAAMSDIPAQHNLRDKALPLIDKKFKAELDSAIKRVM